MLRWLKVKQFTYFGEAICKVVLFKLPSAIVERDFSQYLAITNACGTKLTKPMLQNRMYSRCNKEEYSVADDLASLVLEDSN